MVNDQHRLEQPQGRRCHRDTGETTVRPTATFETGETHGLGYQHRRRRVAADSDNLRIPDYVNGSNACRRSSQLMS